MKEGGGGRDTGCSTDRSRDKHITGERGFGVEFFFFFDKIDFPHQSFLNRVGIGDHYAEGGCEEQLDITGKCKGREGENLTTASCISKMARSLQWVYVRDHCCYLSHTSNINSKLGNVTIIFGWNNNTILFVVEIV